MDLDWPAWGLFAQPLNCSKEVYRVWIGRQSMDFTGQSMNGVGLHDRPEHRTKV